MAALRRSLWAFLLAGVLLASLGCWAAAASADEPEGPAVYSPPAQPLEPPEAADAPSCPEGLGLYDGDEPAVAAVYGLDADLVQQCKVLRFGLARVRERTYWGVAESLGSQALQRESIGYLEQIAEAPAAGEVGGQEVALQELGEVSESGFLSLRFVLWVIAAIVVTGLVAYTWVRLVVFRDN